MSPRGWFLGAAIALVVWHGMHVLQNSQWREPPPPHGDGPDYECLAYSLSQGRGFQFEWQSAKWQFPYVQSPDAASYSQLQRIDWPGPTTSRPPLYPALIAGVYRILPRGPEAFGAIRWLGAICTALAGAIAVGLAVHLSRHLFSSPWVSTVSGLSVLSLALLDRSIRSYSVGFLTEPLAMFLVTCVLACGLKMGESGSERGGSMHGGWVACLAVLAALLVLTRSMMVFWLPGLAAMVAMSVPDRRRRYMFFFLLGTLVLLAPWWVRNCLVLERWMPLGGQGIASLAGGYCDESLADGGNWNAAVETRLQAVLDADPRSSGWTQAEREVQLAEAAQSEVRQWVHRHRSDLPKLVALRIRTHWGPYFGPSLAWRIAMVMGAMVLVFKWRRESIWLLGLPIVSTLTVAILYSTGGRFLVPLYGLLYLVAGIGIAGVLEWGWKILVRLRGQKRL